MDSSSPASNTISVKGTISLASTSVSPSINFPSPPANDSSGDRKPIALWPGMYDSPVTTALWEAKSKILVGQLDPPKDAPPQSTLLTKTPSQSRICILYNFSSDFVLREQYRVPWNEVRIGKLLEDLDALAGTMSVKIERRFASTNYDWRFLISIFHCCSFLWNYAIYFGTIIVMLIPTFFSKTMYFMIHKC